MAKFATFDDTGKPTGFYSDEAFMHGARQRPVYGPAPEPTEDNPHPLPPVIGAEPNPDCKIPPEAVEITEEQYREFIDNPGARCWADGYVRSCEPDMPSLTPSNAMAQIINAINAATASILDIYPAAERLGWDAKAAEAAAVLAAGAGATLAMAPLLTAECAAEYGAAEDAARLTQVAAKAQTVLDKAAAWGQLMATLSGLRGKAFAAIDAAGNDAAALQAAIDAAAAAIAAAAAE